MNIQILLWCILIVLWEKSIYTQSLFKLTEVATDCPGKKIKYYKKYVVEKKSFTNNIEASFIKRVYVNNPEKNPEINLKAQVTLNYYYFKNILYSHEKGARKGLRFYLFTTDN